MSRAGSLFAQATAPRREICRRGGRALWAGPSEPQQSQRSPPSPPPWPGHVGTRSGPGQACHSACEVAGRGREAARTRAVITTPTALSHRKAPKTPTRSVAVQLVHVPAGPAGATQMACADGGPALALPRGLNVARRAYSRAPRLDPCPASSASALRAGAGLPRKNHTCCVPYRRIIFNICAVTAPFLWPTMNLF